MSATNHTALQDISASALNQNHTVVQSPGKHNNSSNNTDTDTDMSSHDTNSNSITDAVITGNATSMISNATTSANVDTSNEMKNDVNGTASASEVDKYVDMSMEERYRLGKELLKAEKYDESIDLLSKACELYV